MSLDKLPFNFFDFLLVGVLVAGLFRGRKQGMSEELLSLLTWVSLIGICSLGYQPLGDFYARISSVFSTSTCYLLAYITLAGAIFVIFALIKRFLGGKLLGSDIFGQSEYYLGMGSGIVRFGCMLLAALALLNSRYYSTAEI